LSPATDSQLTGNFEFGIVNFFAQGQEREKLVAARNATEGWNAEEAPDRRGQTGDKIGRDALEFEIAAD
jgi:hypothetical protein